MHNTRFLRRVFQIDAATCFACFLLLAGAPAALAPWIGLDANLIRIAGLLLLPCAVFFLWLGTRAVLPVMPTIIAILGNFLWAADSFVLISLKLSTLTPFGIAFVTAQALFVIAMAILEFHGFRRMNQCTAQG